MTQAQILEAFKQLSSEEKLRLVKAMMQLMTENHTEGSSTAEVASLRELQTDFVYTPQALAVTDHQTQLMNAAQLLLADYVDDPELTGFTSLDGEDFYAAG